MSETSEQQTAWTVGRLLDWTSKWFQQKQVEGGRLAAELLLARAMGCRKIELYTRFDAEPTDEQRACFRELVRQAGEHTPIAYLLGKREFFSLEFQVTPAVLIPRPETEALAQRMIELCRQSPERQWKILDVGTGSGCVAVAIAKYAANAMLVASDVSVEALAVAQGNVERHGLADRIRAVAADGLKLPTDTVPDGGFDAIVSNPPYIAEQVYKTLPPNVRDHEPRVALVPEGGDGLAMYRLFASQARSVLAPGGRLLAETGHDQHAAVLEIFNATGGWIYVGSHRDRSDPYERVVEFQLR
jgi:release factor glutamine methyltransferase